MKTPLEFGRGHVNSFGAKSGEWIQTLMTLPEVLGTKRNWSIYWVVGCNCKQWKLFTYWKWRTIFNMWKAFTACSCIPLLNKWLHFVLYQGLRGVSLMFEFTPGILLQRSLHDLDWAHTSVKVLTKPRPRVCSHPAMKKNSPQYNNTKWQSSH